MNEKNDVHAFVVYIKKGKRSFMTDSYATPGFATEFMGEKKNRTKIGNLLISSMTQQFKSRCSFFLLLLKIQACIIYQELSYQQISFSLSYLLGSKLTYGL